MHAQLRFAADGCCRSCVLRQGGARSRRLYTVYHARVSSIVCGMYVRQGRPAGHLCTRQDHGDTPSTRPAYSAQGIVSRRSLSSASVRAGTRYLIVALPHPLTTTPQHNWGGAAI